MQEEHTKGREGLLSFSPLSRLWYFSFCAKEMMPANQGKVRTKKSKTELYNFFHFQLAIFAEGTRLTKAKVEASIEYARANGLPELKHHLLPRSKGFALTAQYFKDKGEMAVTNQNNTIWQFHNLSFPK